MGGQSEATIAREAFKLGREEMRQAGTHLQLVAKLFVVTWTLVPTSKGPYTSPHLVASTRRWHGPVKMSPPWLFLGCVRSVVTWPSPACRGFQRGDQVRQTTTC